MAHSALIAAFVAGLLGGLHCAAMCGGWLAATASSAVAGGRAVLLPRRTLILQRLAAHAGRLLTYAALGAALGAGGGAAFALAMAPAQRVLYLIANVALIGLALSMTRREARAPAMAERIGLRVFAHAAPLAGRMKIPGLRAVAMGVLWGLTPCALVYGLLPVALLSGSAANGAAIMLAFGLGTLPNLLAAQALLARARRGIATRWRFAAAVMIAAFGVTGIYRAVFIPEALAGGAYCLIPLDGHGTLAATSP